MLTSTLHTTWIMRFFVLVYLLICVSTSNASFWCQDSGSFSHLESSPVGECWTVSPLEKDEFLSCEEMTKSAVLLSAHEDECFDSPAYSSALTPSNRTSPPSKMATPDIALKPLPFTRTKGSGVAGFAKLALASQLPHPQALTALRTVILLH